MRDGQATRRRMLDAATVEFAERGIAGARVDRIAASATTNKAQMYSYFGSKDGLFDAVFAEHLSAILDAVPLTANDLPGYAVRLYDAHRKHPEFVRLAGWARLERVQHGPLIPDPKGHAEKLTTIRHAQDAGIVDPDMDAADVLSFVVALAMTWSPLSVVVAASPEETGAVHAGRRRSLDRIVRRSFATPPQETLKT